MMIVRATCLAALLLLSGCGLAAPPAAPAFQASYRDRTFESVVVKLDGISYTGCTFRRCTLIYRGEHEGNLDGCQLLDCTWRFEGPARRTLATLRQIGRLSPQAVEAVVRELLPPQPQPPGPRPNSI